MICVAIADKNFNKCLATLDKVEMAEIRIDLTEFDEKAVRKAFSHATPTVATCRADKTGLKKQFTLLSAAIEAGAKYVDVEIEAGEEQIKKVAEIAKQHHCKLIISHHDYELTPDLLELHALIDECFYLGADVAKVATQANSKSDAARLLSLYDTNKSLVILGMGEAGKITRLMSPLLGAEFTFAAMDEGETTAPGQIRYSEMKALLERIEESLSNQAK